MSKDKSVVELAKERYALAMDAYATSRRLAIEDTKFALGDSDNGWQWPEKTKKAREVDQRVCLTVNLTAQHCNQIINNIRMNSPQCRVLPVDNFADKKSAEIMGGLIRNIQTSSNADDAHIVAAEHCIYGGIGYWRVITEYESEKSFNQCIRIKSVPNPLMVYVDPAATELDKSDAEWGFIFEDISRERCEREHKDIDPSSWEEEPDGWVTTDMIRRAEYFYCTHEHDTLYLIDDGSEAGGEVLKSDIPPDRMEEIKPLIISQRDTIIKKWQWCKLLGGHDKPIDERDWPGSFLPIVCVVGKELNVDGEVIRKGVVRDLKDPARMVNFSYSEAVQTIALQNKIPYIASAEAIDGFEAEWGGANKSNDAYLPWNAYDDEGRQLPKPERQQPSVMPSAQVQMLQLSTEQMRAASGQQNANFGIKSEAVSGVGIQRLKVQGETATFHFPDNQVRGLRYEAKLLLDLIPKIYDTKRVVRILGLDGKDEKATLDPSQQSAYSENVNQEDIEKIFNPMLGKYDVVIDTGPSFQTQRQEAAAMLTDLAAKNPQIMGVAGDLVVRAYDFSMADELAKRLEKTLPPGVKEDPRQKDQMPPEAMKKIQEMQMLEESLKEIGEKYNDLENKTKAENEKLQLEAYAKTTDRLKVLAPFLTREMAMQLAENIGLDVANDPDIAGINQIGIDPSNELDAIRQLETNQIEE